jgi:hypothetical protein
VTSLFPARYRKRPIEVEAMQYDGTNFNALWDFTGRSAHIKEIIGPHAPLALAVYTLEGVMKADVGDWIIKGIQGEYYPCKPDIFEQTYEPVQLPRHAWDDVRWVEEDDGYEASCGCGWTDTAYEYGVAEESLYDHLSANGVRVGR